MTFDDILKKYRTDAFSDRNLGDRFERLMRAYLLTDPRYTTKLKDVWLWSDFFARGEFGGHETGIDLVAQTTDGGFWAIQCKCYQEDAYIDKPTVDTFLSTSSRTFSYEGRQGTCFEHRLWISTTAKEWGANAEEAIRNQSPPVSRINIHDLRNAPTDWEKLDKNISGEGARAAKKQLRPHQTDALAAAHKHFKDADRGKLIMACGTGKTFNSLRIAENETGGSGLVLFLVPSIALLGQTLREWCADAEKPITPICICSDPEISKKKAKNEDSGESTVDLALPATTDPAKILKHFENAKKNGVGGMTVAFSTYQSIATIASAQKELLKNGFGEFDLIICDEAHRTTGVTLLGEDESAFVKVHENSFIKAKKRLYMTATPRLYDDPSKSRAAQASAVLCSMDDKTLYGEEIYRIGFGEAVEKGLLADYKVLILTLNDSDVPPAVQEMITDKDQEINADDASKLFGCIKALSKQVLGDGGTLRASDPDPMRRAVAFCRSIKESKKITEALNTIASAYISTLPAEQRSACAAPKSKHIDGTMAAPARDELLDHLKGDTDFENECRILTNVRCLSEGVDVPSLDAVMFLSARDSQVDVVQSVGRVMRKSEGKKYGYIIIPVMVPQTVDASEAMDDNERYKIVWKVLNALRAHDDRFNAIVNKIELNNKRPPQIIVGRPDPNSGGYGTTPPTGTTAIQEDPYPSGPYTDGRAQQLALKFEQLQNVIFAKMVEKVGDRRYWESWAKSVAQIAERQIERIGNMIKGGEHKETFDQFLKALQKNINPSITAADCLEMLSQHIITKPVFDALFEGYSFVNNNPISVSMQGMLDLLESQAIEKDTEQLQKFYESVKMRAKDIDNAKGKQRVVIELYDKFFKTAFPKMVERLGIVYTPVEVVDFIIHSVNDVLKKEFGRTVGDENVNILDPFTGTGTFITRLIQSGLIGAGDLERKYGGELFANEIVLLAYYIAAVNIENAYHEAAGIETYQPFGGICLTDTFQLGEVDEGNRLFSEMFSQNSERVQRQVDCPITVIMGNPPYSVGQTLANDNAQNQEYPALEARIADTYAKRGKATNKNALYDTYIKAFRWSTDRLKGSDGIIAFVSNGAWLDSNSASGFRKCLEDEFSSIYVFNLRGNCRTSGELRRKECGNVFGLGSKTPIAITLLVKKRKAGQDKAKIYYSDIGDYLTREQKLEILKKDQSIDPKKLTEITPNEHGDWVNPRNDVFGTFIQLEPDKKFNISTKSFFIVNSRGMETTRDEWVYNSSRNSLSKTMKNHVSFYNSQVDELRKSMVNNPNISIDDFRDNSPNKISWSSSLIDNLRRLNNAEYEKEKIFEALYRPFFKQHLYTGDKMIHRRGQFEQFFPTKDHKNLIICVSGVGVTKDFSCLITDMLPDLEFIGKSQCFPLHYYEESVSSHTDLFAGTTIKYTKRDAITNFILTRAQDQYAVKNITKEDLFYYVYAYLHHSVYRTAFANDLKKMLPRLPLVEDVRAFWSFVKAGHDLAELHLNYESLGKHSGVTEDHTYANAASSDAGADARQESDYAHYCVEKMRFRSKTDKSAIIYNSRITITDIPMEAYAYVVNGKSAIEWVMERYAVTVHKESGIRNDPNDWAREVGKPRYIIDLLHSVINLSVQTAKIVASLPEMGG